MKWTDKLDGEFNGSPCKIRVGNVVKDYGNFDRPKVGSVSANDLLNDGIPSFSDSLINTLINNREMNLLYHCRYQLVDIITMIDSANTTDDLNLELLKVLVGDILKGNKDEN